jgi:hypothetical protein
LTSAGAHAFCQAPSISKGAFQFGVTKPQSVACATSLSNLPSHLPVTIRRTNAAFRLAHLEYKHFANAIINPDTGALLEYCHLIKSPKHKEDWTQSFSNKLNRLTQGKLGQVTDGLLPCFL